MNTRLMALDYIPDPGLCSPLQQTGAGTGASDVRVRGRTCASVPIVHPDRCRGAGRRRRPVFTACERLIALLDEKHISDSGVEM